ncbi:MAG TPA: hypothetical protein DC001_06975, partial [Clostridiales bacterium]|nr:hypothetical protein [Clostridiales bacterium]
GGRKGPGRLIWAYNKMLIHAVNVRGFIEPAIYARCTRVEFAGAEIKNLRASHRLEIFMACSFRTWGGGGYSAASRFPSFLHCSSPSAKG